ncbi:MAG: ATP-binding protein, partial [Nitrosopumilus sp.]
MVKTDKTKLVAHEKLLIDVIKRQAGTLKKAILEGTMNSVEAGATEIDITFLAEKSKDKENNPEPAFLSIYDDGIGIRTKEELIKHFETFGQPHEDNENIIWKQFRMGRGQMFAFGKNTWRTATFKMNVDVDTTELDYHLQTGLEHVCGCKIDIELYNNPLDNYTISSVKSLKEEVKEQVRYVKIPVKFNDEVVSVAPETLNWDYEDDCAYYKFSDTSQLKIYNLGVYVMSKSIREVGVGGIVVSKTMLKVNFARNDVDSTCPIYQTINKVVLDNKIKKASKQYKSLSADERYSLLIGFRDCESHSYQYESKRILRLTNNKWISWNMFIKDGMNWCFAPAGDMIADKSMQTNKAVCFDETMIEEMGYDGPLDEFFEWLWSDQINGLYSPERKIAELETLKKRFVRFDDNQYVSSNCQQTTLKDTFSETYSYIPYGKLKKTEKRIVDALQCCGCWDGRKIKIGVSDVASSWTDVSTFIA